jgi:hypothetical protein
MLRGLIAKKMQHMFHVLQSIILKTPLASRITSSNIPFFSYALSCDTKRELHLAEIVLSVPRKLGSDENSMRQSLVFKEKDTAKNTKK